MLSTRIDELSAANDKFVTSSTDIVTGTDAYVLVNSADNIVWSGVDLSNIGTDYDISGYGISAWRQDNAYNVKASIVGNNGISAEYDDLTNDWLIGVSADDYCKTFRCEIGATQFAELLEAKNDDCYIYGTLNSTYYTLVTANGVNFIFNNVYDSGIDTWKIDQSNTWTNDVYPITGLTAVSTSGYVSGAGTEESAICLTKPAVSAIESVSSKLTCKENTAHADWTLKDAYVCLETELSTLAQASTNGAIFFIVSATT